MHKETSMHYLHDVRKMIAYKIGLSCPFICFISRVTRRIFIKFDKKTY
jgi:hypothetical protein